MPDPLVLLRLLAHERGRAIPLAATLHVRIQPHALVLALLAMAGEDASVHALAIGGHTTEPEILTTPDPRNRDQQHALFSQLKARLEAYLTDCATMEAFPQVWVSSQAAVRLLDVLSERLRRSRDADDRRLGTILAYLTDRAEIAGQQTLLAATTVLAEHDATGQASGEDAHLGAILAWLDPPHGLHGAEAALRAEQQPLGIKTDPAFDRRVLGPLLARYHTDRQKGASRAMDQLAQQVHAALTPVVTQSYRATLRALELLQAAARPPLPALENLEAREGWAFASFWRRYQEGDMIPLSPSTRTAATKFLDREDAAATYAAALLAGDPFVRAIARARGEVLAGHVAAVSLAGRRPSILVASTQVGLRVRVGDELYAAHDQQLVVQVRDLSLQQGEKHITLEIMRGWTAVGVPASGTHLDLLPAAPDWGRLPRTRRLLRTQLKHLDTLAAIAERTQRSAPDDLLQALEDLQHD